jgi:hypothetical protein
VRLGQLQLRRQSKELSSYQRRKLRADEENVVLGGGGAEAHHPPQAPSQNTMSSSAVAKAVVQRQLYKIDQDTLGVSSDRLGQVPV